MVLQLRKQSAAYAALAAMVVKNSLAFRWAAWTRLLQSVIGLVVFVYFWRAVYANSASIAGLALDTTLGYIMLARIFRPLGYFDLIFEFSYQLREGGIAELLVRPLDVQLAYYAQGLATLAGALGQQLPVVLVALLVFRLRFPSNPLTWAVFIVSVLLGRSVMFCLDFVLGCLTLYTTNDWGLNIASIGLTTFFGGGLVPLVMMPGWLQTIVTNTPFAQGVFVPIALLSGVLPLSEAPRLLLTQCAWLVGMVIFSRGFYTIAIRRITIQGG
jgi:ABC-2 type transport system permease protein